ncbi:MAG: tetratricopeptide repeat protein, partial [Planctomycetota bacterium]
GEWVRLVFSFVLTLLACLSKESGMITGALILLAWICFKRLRSRSVALHGMVALISAGFYLAIRTTQTGVMQGQVPPHGGSWFENFFYACFGSGYQALLVFRPWFSNVDYQDGFFDSIPYTHIVVMGSLFPIMILAGLFLFRRNEQICFSLSAFCICMLPTSSLIFPLRSLVNDRYLYLPLVGVALLLSYALNYSFSAKNNQRPAASLAMVALLAALAGLSFARSSHWRNGESLWLATLKTHPRSIKARLGLSREWFNDGRTERSLAMIDETLAMAQPGTAIRTDALYLKAQSLTRMGHVEDAAACLRRALEESSYATDLRTLQPRLNTICRNLWDFEMKAGNFAEALAVSEKLIRLEGQTVLNLLLSGKALRGLDRNSEAISLLQKGAELYPGCEELRSELDDLLESNNKGKDDKTNLEPASDLPGKKQKQ